MVSPGNHEANCVNGGQKNKKMHITYDETYCLEGQTEFKFFRYVHSLSLYLWVIPCDLFLTRLLLSRTGSISVCPALRRKVSRISGIRTITVS